MATPIELDPDCVRDLVKVWNECATSHESGRILPYNELKARFEQALVSSGVRIYAPGHPDGWSISRAYTTEDGGDQWTIQVQRREQTGSKRWSCYLFPAATHLSLIHPGWFDVAPLGPGASPPWQRLTLLDTPLLSNHFLRISKLHEPYFYYSEGDPINGLVSLGLQGDDHVTLKHFLRSQIYRAGHLNCRAWPAAWAETINLQHGRTASGDLWVQFPGGLKLVVTTAGESHGSAQWPEDDANGAAHLPPIADLRLWAQLHGRSILLSTEKLRPNSLPQIDVNSEQLHALPPGTPPADSANRVESGKLCADSATQPVHTDTNPAQGGGQEVHPLMEGPLASDYPRQVHLSISERIIQAWSRLYTQTHDFDIKQLKAALLRDGIEAKIPVSPDHMELLFVENENHLYYMVPATRLSHDERGDYYEVKRPCTISQIEKLATAKLSFQPKSTGICSWHRIAERTEPLSKTLPDTHASPLRALAQDRYSSHEPQPSQDRRTHRDSAIANEVMRRWHEGWIAQRPGPAIRQELATIAGVKQVFRSESLQLYVCVVSETAAIGVPCFRDYDNNREAFEAETPATNQSKVSGLLSCAEVTPSGDKLLTKGRVTISG
jgi:hypothetical protein